MKPTVQPTINNLLAYCLKVFTHNKLSLNSRKLYLADIKRFLSHLEQSGLLLTTHTLGSSSTYTSYLAHLQRQSVSPSVLSRTLASLRQLGSVVSETYSVPNPVASLTLSTHSGTANTSPTPHDKYIKYYINHLKAEQFSNQTIKSYKSDIEQYCRWAVQVIGSTSIDQLLTKKNSEKYTNHLSKHGIIAASSIERKSASLSRFRDWYLHAYPTPVITDSVKPLITHNSSITSPEVKEIVVPPQIKPVKSLKNISTWATPSWSTVISFVLLLTLIGSFGFFGYRQLMHDRVLLTQAYPSSPVTPNRQLSFQGRLESTSGTPITVATNFVFKLFDAAGSGNPPTGGTQLYTTGTCSITPDSDGVFSTQIGDSCGSAIPATVFTENANVFLEVTVGSETLSPRQEIATVAYALNSETLQGFPISATVSAVANTVVPMNQWGEIIVGEQSPRIKGVSGTLQISAPTLSFITASGSNGNITFAPDGTGQVNLNGNTTTTNFFNVANAQLTTGSLITGTVANNNSGFKLIDLLSGASPTSKFSVDDAGLTTIGGDLYVSSGISLYNTAVSDDAIEAAKFCTGDGETNCVTDFSALSSGSTIWTDTSTNTYLTTTTDELILGGSSPLSSAKFSIDGDTDQIQQVVQGHSTQTANLQEWQSSAGTVQGFVSPSGRGGFNTLQVSGTFPAWLNGSLYSTKNYTTADSNAYANYLTASVNPSAPINFYPVGVLTGISIGASSHATTGSATGGAFSSVNYNNNNGMTLIGGSFGVGNGNTVTASSSLMSAGIFTSDAEDGTVTTLRGLHLDQLDVDAGSVTTAVGIDMDAPVIGAGSMTNVYGIRIGNVNVGSTLNYAIYTNAGINRFGDDLYLASGLSTFGTAVSDGTIEATQFCTGDGETNCITDFSTLSGSTIWTDGGTYIYPTNTEVLGNSTSAGANKLAGAYLTDSAPLTFGTDNDVSLSFDNTSSTLNLTQGNNDVNFDANTLFVDGSANNVGIGTTGPSYKLDVVDSIAGNQVVIRSKNSSTATGNTTASVLVENSASYGQLYKAGTNYTTWHTVNANDLGFYNQGAGNISILNDYATGNINFATGGVSTPQMIILSTGSVGVGTTGPDAKLDSLATTGEQLRLTYTDGSVFTGFTVDSSGNLTIDNSGTLTTFADSLAVNGNLTLGDAITDTLTFTGRVAQDSDLIPITTTGTNDLGTSALPWDNVYANNLYFPTAGAFNLADNTAGAFQLKEGSNVYMDISTTNESESFSLNLPVGGGTSQTANLFTSNIAKTINIGTGTSPDTINIGTGGTTADTIKIGGLSTTHTDITGLVNFAGSTTYYIDATGNAKFNDLIIADTGNPGLTIGNGSIGFFLLGGSTLSDNNGNLLLDSDTAQTQIADDLQISGNDILDSAAATRITLGATTTLTNTTTTLSGTSTLTAASLATLDTAATVAWDVATLNATSLATFNPADTLNFQSTTVTFNSNSTLNGGSAANDDLTLQGTSNATRTSSYVLLQPSGGNVGIGDTTPGKTLSINGDIEISSATGKLFDTFVTSGISLGATNETALVGFGATSLVGALNELKNSNKNSAHNDYLSWANHYLARGEGGGKDSDDKLSGLFFDTFYDSTKSDFTTSTSSGIIQVSDPSAAVKPAAPYRVGLMGGQTYSTATTDNDGQTYLGSNTVNDIYYYDRTRDSVPAVLVELGIDPNWYNGVTLSVATSSANLSQSGTIADKNPNLTTQYNGSLIKATGTDTTPRTIFITIKSPTTFDWTNYQGDAATGVTITPGTAQTLGVTGVSVTFTAATYNVGDVFKIASWFIEAAGSTRGSKPQFPERSNIVVNGNYTSIIDADTQKLWMRTEQVSWKGSLSPDATTMLNGTLYIAANNSGSSDGNLRVLNFVNDDDKYIYESNTYRATGADTAISSRNTAGSASVVVTPVGIVTRYANDVAAAVVPNQPTQEVTVSGWGFINVAAADATETVNLPYTFNNTPTVNITYNGYKATTPNSLAECVLHDGTNVDYKVRSITKNNFLAYFETDATAWSAYACYSWTATGTVSPKQFAVVATGASGVDGGTTIINETDGRSYNIEVGSQYAPIWWQNKVALTSKGDLYIGHHNGTDNFNSVEVYQGIHGINRSETTITEFRSGYYLGGWSAGSEFGTFQATYTNTNPLRSLSVSEGTSTLYPGSNTIYVGDDGGTTVIQENAKCGLANGGAGICDGYYGYRGSVKYYTKDYISEEMVGDIRGMWPLNNGNSSSDFEDVSVKANTLTGTNITAAGDSVSGVRGTATDFDGSTEYLSCTDANCGGTSKLDPGTADWSYGAWFKSSTAARQSIMRKGGGTAGGTYLLELTSAGLVSIYFSDQTNTMSFSSNRTVNDGRWHHAVFVADRDVGGKLYIDGVLDNSAATATPNSIDNTSIFTIGIAEGPLYYFNGQIDEAFVTANALSPHQVKLMYEVGSRSLQSHGTGLGGGAADTNQQLGGTTNVVGDVQPDWNNQYMYVGTNSTTTGALSKIQLNSDTNIKTYTSSANTPTGGSTLIDEDTISLGVGYQLETVGSAASGVKGMSPDNNATGSKGSFYSKTQTLNSATKYAFGWFSIYKDGSDLDSNFIPYACNAYATAALCTSNSAWVAGTPIQIDSTLTPPEQEYGFTFPSTGSYLTMKLDFYRDAANSKANTYLTRYGLTWSSSTGGADIAERYQSSEPVYPGDIVTIDSPVASGTATVKLSNLAYDNKVIGVVTTNPGIVMDDNMVDLNFNAASRNSPDRPAVALAGRVPVKVTTLNGNIQVGDPITSSLVPGFGIKATQSGTIIGKALEDFSCDSPSSIPTDNNPAICSGTVLTFINIGHYEPVFYLTDLGDFVFSNDSSSDNLANSTGSAEPTIKLVRILTNGTQEVVDRIGTFGSLIANTIKGQSLKIDTISPLASGSAIQIDGPVVISPDRSNQEPALTIEGELVADSVSSRVAKLGELQVDRLTASEIVADKITAGSIEGLDARIASLSAGTTNDLTDSELETITERIRARISNLTVDSSIASDLPVSVDATSSAMLEQSIAAVNLSSPSATLASADIDFVTINSYLAVIGHATMTSLSVTSTLTTNTIQSEDGTLSLQPLGGNLRLAGDVMIINASGEVAINGNLTIMGAVLGESAEFGTLAIGNAQESSPSAIGQLLAVYNEQGEAVATIDASGSATLAGVTTHLITISPDQAATDSATVTQASSESTAGESLLAAGKTELTINSKYVTSNSLVYLTPTTNTDNKVLFIKAKESCSLPAPSCTRSFTVGIDTPAQSDIQFNWWIIELKK